MLSMIADVVCCYVAPGQLRIVRCERDPAEDIQVVLSVAGHASEHNTYINAAGDITVRRDPFGSGVLLLNVDEVSQR
jgi:hypothetical protein